MLSFFQYLPPFPSPLFFSSKDKIFSLSKYFPPFLLCASSLAPSIFLLHPLHSFSRSKGQKSKIPDSESESRINLRICLGHFVLFLFNARVGWEQEHHIKEKWRKISLLLCGDECHAVCVLNGMENTIIGNNIQKGGPSKMI